MRILALTTLLLTGALLAACGGGGDGPSSPFRGHYWRFDFGGSVHGQSMFLLQTRGTVYVDSARTSRTDAVDIGVGPSPTVTGEHSVDADRNLYGEGGWTYAKTGGVSPLGRCAVAARTAGTVWPSAFILLGHVGGFDDSSLDGLYHLVGLQRRYLSVEAIHACEAEFDGTGGYEASTAFANLQGRIFDVTPEAGLTYSVSPDGLLIMDDLAAAMHLQGGVLAGGQVALAAGPTATGTLGSTLYALLAQATGLTGADFDGSYWTVSLEYEPDAVRSTIGTLVADGSGGYAYSFTECLNVDLRPISLASRMYTGTYAVADDGTLEITAEGGDLVGGLTQAGDFFVLAGGAATGDRSVFMFGVVR